MLVFKLNQDIIRGCAPIADKDGHSFNDSKKSFTLASPTRNKNASVMRQLLLDNQALNQAFFVSKLVCVFQGTEACIASVVGKKKESLPFGCQHSSSNVFPHPVIQVPNCEKKKVSSAALRETSNSFPHYTDPNTTPKARTVSQQESLSAKFWQRCPPRSIHRTLDACAFARVPPTVGPRTADGQIQASIPGNPPCFMALLMASPNVYGPRRWSFPKECDILDVLEQIIRPEL